MYLFQQVLALQTLLKQNFGFSSIDFQLAQLLATKETKSTFQDSIFLLTLLLSQCLNRGAIFLDEIQFKASCLKIVAYLKKESLEIDSFRVLNFLEIAQSQSVGAISEKKPLIFDKVENKFYFQKFYNYQALVFLDIVEKIFHLFEKIHFI